MTRPPRFSPMPRFGEHVSASCGEALEGEPYQTTFDPNASDE